MTKIHRSPLICIVILTILLLVPACSQKKSEPQKPGSASEEKPQAPSALKNMADNLDGIITELEAKRKMERSSSLQQNTQLSSPQQSQEKSAKSGNAGGDSSQNQQTKWEKENKELKSLHQNWNTLEPEAMEAGLKADTRNNFEKGLDQLTQTIAKQEVDESLQAAISLLMNYADLTEVFSNKLPPEFFRVKYETMILAFKGEEKEWQAAREHIPKLEEHWEALKMQAKDSDKKVISRTEFALRDLQQSLDKEEVDLVLIKGEIAMKDLKKLEETF